MGTHGRTGLGYTYGDVSVASFVESELVPVLEEGDAGSPPALRHLMGRRIRNAGRPGAGAMALSAVDVALWDLEARPPEIHTDAGGELGREQAPYRAHRFHDEWDVRWFEGPVGSADLDGLRMLRDRGPARLEIAAGEYACTTQDFASLIDAPAVDRLQVDVTRCGGITGVLEMVGRGPPPGPVRPPRARRPGARVPRGAPAAAPGVLPRPCAARTTGVRRHPVARGRRPVSRHGRPGLGMDVRWPDAERYRVYGTPTA